MMGRAFRRSITDFKRHPWLHFVSISTITAALIIQGSFLLVYRNFESIAEKTNPYVTGTAYLIDGLQESQIAEIRAQILDTPGVKRVVFKTRESVVNELQSFLGAANKEAIPGSELFPDVLEIDLARDASARSVTQLKDQVAKLAGIAEVDFSEDWLVQYRKARHFLTVFGVILIVAMILGSSFIIANFMGMRHQSRKSEIEIVRLIGGHQNFVLKPFLWEAFIEGVIGISFSLIGLYVLKTLLSAVLTVQWSSFIGTRQLLYLSPGQVALVCALGVAMAMLGSFTVFLRFQESKRK